MKADLPKKIYYSRPSIILNLDNEYMTFTFMEEIKRLYDASGDDLPKRHYYNKFVRDLKHWAEQYVDFMHYTIPLHGKDYDKY